MDNVIINIDEAIDNVTISVSESVDDVEVNVYEYVNWIGGGDSSMWEIDGATTIKPKDSKTVDGSHLSGVVTGGIFQP